MVALPTLYEWAGGHAALRRLTEVFYDRVLDDELLRPRFERMSPHHREHVAVWLGEVFGGPKRYTDELGCYSAMLGHHRGLALTEPERARWAALIAASADEAGLPANSQPDATPPPKAPVPRWGWGEAPPYLG